MTLEVVRGPMLTRVQLLVPLFPKGMHVKFPYTNSYWDFRLEWC